MQSSFKGELKSQVAAEAGRDPDSKVTAEDAETVIMEESKRAGAEILQFDPNASPEQKAAQAASVSSRLPFRVRFALALTTSPVGNSPSARAQGRWGCHRHCRSTR